MDTGVDNQPGRAVHLRRQVAELRIGIGVETHLVSEALGIKRPAFGIGHEECVAPEFRQCQFLRAGHLQVMSWNGFMQHQRFHGPFRAPRQRIDVGLEIACATPVRCAAHVVLGIVSFLRAHGAHTIRQSRKLREQLWQFRVGSLGDIAIARQHVVCLGVQETRIGVDRFLEFGARALEPRGGDRRVHLLADPRDLGETQLVYLLRRHGGRRIFLQARFVVRRPSRKRCRRNVLARRRQIALGIESTQAAKGRNHLVLDDALTRHAKARGIPCSDIRRILEEWLVLRILGRIRIDLRVELSGHAGDRDFCRHPSQLHAGLHSRDKLIDLHGQCAETRDVRFVIPHRREARGIRPRRNIELRPIKLSDRRPEFGAHAGEWRAQLTQSDCLLELMTKDPKRGPVGRQKFRCWDLGESL